MFYKILIFITLLTPLSDSFRSGVTLSKTAEKRSQKSLSQHFNKEDFSKIEIHVQDSILSKTNSYFYFVENSSKSTGAYMVITIANGCRLGGCDVEHGMDEEFEQFYVYSLFDSNADLIDLKIIDYPSEHGYEITSKWWLKLFIKQQKETYEYGKSIDAISGATISVKSMIREMTYLKKSMPQVISEHKMN